MKKFFAVLFVLSLSLVTAALFALPDRDVSELENRSLTGKKNISFNVLNGDFQDSLESFTSDQFPLRDRLVYFQTGLFYLSGQREIDGAYVCDDGRLVQIISEEDLNKKSLLRYAEKINSIAEKNKVYVMYVPSACAELKNGFIKGARVYDYERLYNELSRRLEKAEIIDLYGALSNPDFYYKTDHHWNIYGAYEAYKAFCRARGVEPASLDSYETKTVTKDFQGTLFSKIPISKQTDEIIIPSVPEIGVTADGQKTDFYCLDALETKDKYNVFQGGNHGTVEIENKNGNGKTLLILKDSFANSFVPFIAGEYSKIVLLDERYVFISLEEYVNNLSPDEILVLREIIN
ncbi:MAG: hypothetical protein K5755_04855 [Clostridiales bacterium]|nr:hypothetical protein [Clostridiales bacterium]